MPRPPVRVVTHAFVLVVAAMAAIACNGPTEPASCGDAFAKSRIVAFPTGWTGYVPVGYQVGTEHYCPHGGKSAGYLTSTQLAPNEFTHLSQFIRADDFRGKRVRWSGWVRHESISQYGGLWMRIDGPGETQGFDNSFTHPLKFDSNGWKKVEVVLDVRDNAIGIAFGILMRGSGDIVVDDLVMEVVPMSVASTDTYLVPVANDIPAATTIAQYSLLPRQGTNFDFEGSGPAVSLRADLPPGWVLAAEPQRGPPRR